MHIDLPDELVAQIDAVANDRSAFVAEAVRRLLREPGDVSDKSETDLINELADELNAEAEDVLEYQAIT
jgi:metal-responsive CopG/Arc/MetJ family transcriptional regulator